MNRARVIFADGSKQMAHNTDDLYFRWYERKVAEAEEVHEQAQRGFTVRDCTNSPADYAEALKWRNELSGQRVALEQYLDVLKAKYGNGKLYDSESLSVRMALKEIYFQQSLLNPHWKRFNHIEATESQPTRQKLYISFLRGSMINLARTLEDECAKAGLEAILNYRFAEGDTPLFCDEQRQ